MAQSDDQDKALFGAKQTDGLVTAAVLVIGDEILSGRTKDKNIGFIAEYLTASGIQLREVRVVPDVHETIVAAIEALSGAYDYLFTTGGIGPTHDDITADAVAAAAGVPLNIDPRAVALLEARHGAEGLNDARMRMARIPDGADLIENKVTAAPGFRLNNIIVMAGVPSIMQSMLDAVAPTLKTGRKVESRTILANHREGDLAALLGELQSKTDVAIGSYPSFENGVFRTSVVLRSADADALTVAEAERSGGERGADEWSADEAETAAEH
ncbi:MAG: molybdopterin-binding protein, partial [Pseudomonadota bacterium]